MCRPGGVRCSAAPGRHDRGVWHLGRRSAGRTLGRVSWQLRRATEVDRPPPGGGAARGHDGAARPLAAAPARREAGHQGHGRGARRRSRRRMCWRWCRAGAASGDDAVDAVEHRRVTATGTYADDDTFVVENRTFNGASGGWVLTPLVLADGSAVVVNRGFLGFDREGVIDPPPAPAGEVVVDGVLLESERARAVRADRSRRRHARRCSPGSTSSASPSRWTTTCCPPYLQRVSSDPDGGRAAPGAPELVALGPPRAVRGSAPRLRRRSGSSSPPSRSSATCSLLRRVARDEARERAGAGRRRRLDSRARGPARRRGLTGATRRPAAGRRALGRARPSWPAAFLAGCLGGLAGVFFVAGPSWRGLLRRGLLGGGLLAARSWSLGGSGRRRGAGPRWRRACRRVAVARPLRRVVGERAGSLDELRE